MARNADFPAIGCNPFRQQRKIESMLLPPRSLTILVHLALLSWWCASCGHGQSVLAEAQRIDHPAIDGANVFRLDRQLFLIPPAMTESGSVTLPRFCASLRSAGGIGDHDAGSVTLHPEPSRWIVRWSGAESDAAGIMMEFEQPPRLSSELEPSTAAADGSILLHAFEAITSGEKLRYEPQPFKNTVGYWTVPGDTASWRLRLDKGGRFNVGILQGCGEGQGGSRGSIRLQRADQNIAALDFDVVETGHFQNFQWHHLGQLNVPQSGTYSLKIMPITIQGAALMDVRAIHLIPIPEGQGGSGK